MELLKRILVATDFSNTSGNVIDNAIDMAKIFESEIALVYVLPAEMGSKTASDLLTEFATKELTKVNERVQRKGITTLEPVLESGNFSDKIIEVSEKINANVIFAGSGEKLKNDTFQLGSNAEKIIQKSNKPVFIVKNEKSLRAKKIVCPVDFSAESARALQNAISLAHRFKAELLILSVYDDSDLFTIRHNIIMDEQIEYLRNNCQKEFDSFLEQFALSGLKVTTEIKKGDPATEILNTIKTHKTDLLIMGTTGKSGISKILLGSVTDKVIREVPSSFITLKTEDVIKLELESKILGIEFHFNQAQQLFEDGFFEESINEYNKCLNISFMHVPSLQGLTKVYKEIGDPVNENIYRTMTTEVMEKMYNEKIESEIRRHRN